jgi:hypothetical protein
MQSSKRFLGCLLMQLALVSLFGPNAAAADAKQPETMKVLMLSGGGYHDYAKLVPFLTNALSHRVNARFTTTFEMDVLRDAQFADSYDLVVYDLCFDAAPDGDDSLCRPCIPAITQGQRMGGVLRNAIQSTRSLSIIQCDQAR